jgi:hypothetical protein
MALKEAKFEAEPSALKEERALVGVYRGIYLVQSY